METSTITIYADYQKLTVRSGVMRYASDTVNYVRADFEFGKGWEGFDAIQAVWKSKYETVSVLLDEEGCCMVPQEVLARRSKVQVNLVGFTVDGGSMTERLTSYPALALDVDVKAEIYGNETADITPNQFEQFVGIVAENASSARTSALSANEAAMNASESATESSDSASNALASEQAATASANAASQSAASASTSAGSASTSADSASQSAQSASASAQSASTDADRAEAAAGRITGMNATANTLAPGSEATASYSDGLLTLGIPQGIQGERGPQGIQGVKGDTGDRGLKGDTGNGIASAVLNSDYTLTLTFTDGTTYTTPSIRGAQGDAFEYSDFTPAQLEALTGPQGETGNGIASASVTNYQLVLLFTDGTTYKSGSLRGAKGSTGAKGATGATGNGISRIEKTSTEGLVDTYTITFTNGTTTTFNVTNGREAYTAGTGIDITNGVISIDLDNAEGSNY